MSHYTPEQRYLLDLLSFDSSSEIRKPDEPFSWDVYLSLSHISGLHGLFFSLWNEINPLISVPIEILQNQKAFHQGNILKAMKMSYELLRIMDFLTSSSIEALTFKGPTLAKQFYGDISARSYCDLDILVKPIDVKKSIEKLQKLGYEYQASDFSASDMDKHIKMRQECTLIHPEKGIPIDLHWGFHKTTVKYIKDVNTLFERSVNVELVPEKQVRTLSPVDLLFIESVHLFDDFSKKYFSLKLATDYLKIAQSLSEEQWNKALDIHRENRQLKKLYCWCSLIKILFNVRLPDVVEEGLRKNRTQVKLSYIIAEQFFDESPSFDVKYLLFCSSLFDSTLDSIRFLLHLLLFSITDEDKFQSNSIIKLIFKVMNPIRKCTVKLVK